MYETKKRAAQKTIEKKDIKAANNTSTIYALIC
jgi:hypothetical protein